MNPIDWSIRGLSEEDYNEMSSLDDEAQKRNLFNRTGEILLKKDEVKELTSMNMHQRKGWMRNQKCPCGSNKKFKNCCINGDKS